MFPPLAHGGVQPLQASRGVPRCPQILPASAWGKKSPEASQEGRRDREQLQGALAPHRSLRGREVVGKGGSGQGFKDPKSQPRAAERGEGQSLWQDPLPSEALTMSFCLRKSSVNLAGRSPSRARASRSGHPPMPSHGLPLHPRALGEAPPTAGKGSCLRFPCLALLFLPLRTLLL